MNVADLDGVALDYWVARSLHDFVREIYFTDSGETVSIRGNDRGRPWDGRFTPSVSWEAAAVVLERAQRLEIQEHTERDVTNCVVQFQGENRTVEGRGDSLRLALLRAFVTSRFGGNVDDELLREPQALTGGRVRRIDEQVGGVIEDIPHPEGRIGDIKSTPRP